MNHRFRTPAGWSRVLPFAPKFAPKVAPKLAPTLALTLALAGCAGFSPDGGMNTVSSLTEARSGQTVRRVDPEDASVRAEVARLVAAPLTQDAAITLALLNNRGLQASYAELGISEADLVQAGRLRNPTFSFGRLTRVGELEIDRKLTLPILGLLTLPLTQRIEGQRFAAAQTRAAADSLRLIDEVRRAWVQAVAAEETLRYAELVRTAAEAAGELARRMAERGNWSALQEARERAFHADATARFARAEQGVLAARERLARLLGLERAAALRLPERLPDLPAAPRNLADVEGMALQNRLDLVAARQQLAALADNLGLTRTTRFVNVFDLGLERNTATGQERQTGYEIELQIPLFDWGTARVARAESVYLRGAQQAAQLAIEARSEAREAQGAVQSAWRIARHYRDDIVPLKKRIADEQLLRYNGMLASVFELLADAREQVASVVDAIDATRDYWLADAALQMALTGRGFTPLTLSTGGSAAAAPAQAGGH